MTVPNESEKVDPLDGRKMTAEVPVRPRYRLKDLVAEMKGEPHRVEGWDEMPQVGKEFW